jgi:hypothetical protein
MGISAEKTFPYPIGILLFNSPEYSEIVLRSLSSQDIKVDPSRVVIVVDGYTNSKDEAVGKDNQVDQVIKIAKKYFPDSRIVHNKNNQGIAKQFHFLENELFNFPNSEWALFCEHDFELFPNYLRGIDTFVKVANQFDEVVQVDCTGDSAMGSSRGLNSAYPAGHHWAYALKKSHHSERNFILSEYVDSISTSYYFWRDWQKTFNTLRLHGVYPLGSEHDLVKQAIRNKMGKLALTSGLRMGRHIGAEGEHFIPEMFAKMGYQDWDSYRETEFHISPHEVEKILTVLKHEVLLSVYQGVWHINEFWFSQMDQAHSWIASLQNECTMLKSENENLKSSMSWRMTALFREIDKAINSLFKKS